MARLPRIVVPGVPHHITQRGNRRQSVFFKPSDYAVYLRILKEQSAHHGLKVWAYCLMSNHVHLVVVPHSQESLADGIGEAHRRYTRFINAREGWKGYLWQGRFASFPLSEAHTFAAIRYVERNPVAAGIVQRAEDYPWSSARAHVCNSPDPLLTSDITKKLIPDWGEYLNEPGRNAAQEADVLERHDRTGRPYGGNTFTRKIEKQIGRRIRPKKPGRPHALTAIIESYPQFSIVSPEKT